MVLETVLPDGKGGLFLIGDKVIYHQPGNGKIRLHAKGLTDLTAGAVALAANGDLCVADAKRIVRIGSDGKVTDLARGFKSPFGLALDAKGNGYVADSGDHCIYHFDARGKVTKLAGSGKTGHKDGKTLAAEFHYPSGLVLDTDGNLFVKESGRNENAFPAVIRIRKITPQGDVSTLARISTR